MAPRLTYRRLGGLVDHDEEPNTVWSVVCFFVARRVRGQGIMTQLRGAAVVEAYPVDPGSPS